jgi:hypothetical protein
MINKAILEKMQEMVNEYDELDDHDSDFNMQFKDDAYGLFVDILKSEASIPTDYGGREYAEDKFREELLKSLQDISYALEKGIRIQK